MDGLVVATLSGVIVTALAWLVGDVMVGSVRKRRERRRQIVMLVARAHIVAFRALRDGLYERAWIEHSAEPLRDVRAQYDDLTADALTLFTADEHDVAMWTAVELYAGWHAPIDRLVAMNAPRRERDEGEPPLMGSGDAERGVVLARADELADWAVSWRPGNRNGPRIGDAHLPGDMSRHDAFPPHTDVVTDMLRPPSIWLRDASPRIPARERARLTRRYGWSREAVEAGMRARAQGT